MAKTTKLPEETESADLQRWLESREQREPEPDSAPTVQPHILKGRVAVREFVRSQGLISEPPEFSLAAGLMVCKLTRPVTRGDIGNLGLLLAADTEALLRKPIPGIGGLAWEEQEAVVLAKRERMKESRAKQAELRRARAFAIKLEEEGLPEDTSPEQYYEETGEEPESRSSVPAEEKLAAKGFSVLTKTSKMGAYSFNLPAGPSGPVSLGTCPVSTAGFPLPRFRKHVEPNDLGAAYDLPRSSENNERIDENSWICSHCYALKNAYGNPSAILIMELRRKLIAYFLDEGGTDEDGRSGVDAVATMIRRSIQWAQLKSVRALERHARRPLKNAAMIPDPRFFRIHDAGDFGFGPRYVEAWIRVVNELSQPVTLRMPKVIKPDTPVSLIDHGHPDAKDTIVLPAITFWAATRVWSHINILEQLAQGVCDGSGDRQEHCVPPNLTIRPSALFFGQSAPDLNGRLIQLRRKDTGERTKKIAIDGYAAGTAVEVRENLQELVEFVCPAYMSNDLNIEQTKPKAHRKPMPAHERGGAKEDAPGSCQKAYGPHWREDKADLPFDQGGHGCRACWYDKKMSVGYPRH